MKPIVSGTSAERIVRAALLMLLINGLAGAFLWDGYIGYVRDNVRQLVESLGLGEKAHPTPIGGFSAAGAARWINNRKDEPQGAGRIEALGSPSLVHGEDAYYLGRGGYLRIHRHQGKVEEAVWREAVHSESDLAWQLRIGYGLTLLGLATVMRFLRVVTTGATLTDEGLRISRRTFIPMAAMTALKKSDTGDGVDLHYSVEERQDVVRLDDYRIKKAGAIVAALRDRKGFLDPG